MQDDIFQDCYKQYINNPSGRPIWDELAKKHNYPSGENLRSAFKNERKKRDIPGKDSPLRNSTSFRQTKDSIHIVCSSPRIKSEQDVIDEFNIDTSRWVLDDFTVKTSEGYRKDREVDWEVTNGYVTHGHVRDSGKMLVVPLFHITAKFKLKKIEDISPDELLQMLQEKDFSVQMPSLKDYAPSDEVLEIDVTDLHFGSDANHAPEKRFLAAVDDVVARIGKRKFDKTILAVLSDIFHYDGIKKTTTEGTIVTANGMTAYSVFDMGLTTLIEAIKKLIGLAPLEIVFVPGNHDRMAGYTLIKAIEAYFKDTDTISVDSSHSGRKFRRIGISLVGWMHGDMPKMRSMKWLQVEAREEWGKTKYSEIHAGNFHSQRGDEEGGVVLRYLPGLTDTDGWHYDKGYVGAVRALVSFVWDKKKGLREMWFTNI